MPCWANDTKTSQWVFAVQLTMDLRLILTVGKPKDVVLEQKRSLSNIIVISPETPYQSTVSHYYLFPPA